MNRKGLIIGIIVATSLVVGVWITQKNDVPTNNFPKRTIDVASVPRGDDEYEEDESENPIERLEFEMGQLVNPATGEVPRDMLQKELAYAKKFLNPTFDDVPQGKSQFSFNTQPASSVQNSENFINMGPYNIGGRTRAVVIDINDEDIIIAGGISGGVWKSANQGESWTRTSALEQHPAITSIVQDKRSGKTNEWYYSTGEFSGNSASASGAFYLGNGIYKSTDNGDSWSLITSTAVSGTSGTDVIIDSDLFTITNQLAIDHSEASGTEIYAAVVSQIVRSTDGFQTFEVVLGQNNTGNNWSDVAVTSTGKVYASIGSSSFNGSNGESGLFKSDDGITWTQIRPQTNFPSSFGRFEIAIDPNDENRVLFLGEEQLFLYLDASNSWIELTNNINNSGNDVGQGHGSQGGYDLYVAIHPGNSNTVFLGGINLMRSLNSFGTPALTSQVGGYANDNNPNSFPRYANHHPDNHGYAFFPSNPDRMLTSTDGGIHLTENNQATTNASTPIIWESLNNGYITSQFYHADIHKYDFGDPQLVGGMQDNGSWAKFESSPAEVWTEVFGGDGAFAAISYNALYVSSQRGNVLRFGLENNTYSYSGNISPTTNDNDYLFINPYIVNPVRQDQMFVAARGRVFYHNDVRTNPSAGNWSQITNSSLNAQSVSALGMSIQPEGVLYFGTRSGRIFKVQDTQDLIGDFVATNVTGANLPSGSNVSSIAVDPNDANKVIITFSNYEVVSVWYSENGGATWTSISGNMEENPNGSGAGPSVRSVEIMPDGSGGNYYFLGTSVGLYMTQALDGDNTVWVQQASQTIGNVVVSNIEARPVEGMIMVSTHGNGTFFGFYDIGGVVSNINYTLNEEEASVTMRGNISYESTSTMAYQWLKNGVEIDGANSSEFVVTDGGDYQLRLLINGIEGVGLSNIVSINLDGQGPVATSITRLDPTTQTTDLATVVFQVTFNEDVVNVSADDFVTNGTASGTPESVVEVTASTVYNVTVSGVGGSGDLGLEIASINDIEDVVGNAFSGTIESAETYVITDSTEPTAAISRGNPSTEVTDEFEVVFRIAFSENVQGVDLGDFILSSTSPSADILSVEAVTGTRVYDVTITQILTDGTVNLDFSSAQNITDLAGNAFAGIITSEETYTIQNVIASIDEDLIKGSQKILVDANPSNGVFNLVLPESFNGPVVFNVVSANGTSIQTGSVNNYITGDQLKLDISKEADGLYIFEAISDQRKATVKLLKRTN